MSLSLSNGTALRTLAELLISLPFLNDGFQLRAEVGDVQRLLADDGGLGVCSRLAVPAQTV